MMRFMRSASAVGWLVGGRLVGWLVGWLDEGHETSFVAVSSCLSLPPPLSLCLPMSLSLCLKNQNKIRNIKNLKNYQEYTYIINITIMKFMY